MSGNLKLATLNLQNFATFQDQTISFIDGFNSIVGETGSGKSLILDALQLVLGQRADKKIIRKNCDFGCVEAVFSTTDPDIKRYFMDIGHPFDEEIVIKRIILKSGSSKAYLNFQQCPVSLLAQIGKRFIDLVGQFENQKLFSEKYQLSLLDNFSGNAPILSAYQDSWSKYQGSLEKLEALKASEKETAQRLDYINFQLDELEALGPDVEDEKELKKQKEKCLEVETNKKALEEINFYFDGSDEVMGLQSIMAKLDRAFVQAKGLDPELLNRLRQNWEDLKDINFQLNKSLVYEISDAELSNIIERLDQYRKLHRKFGVDTDGLVLEMEKFLKEKETLENIDLSLKKVEKECETFKNELLQLALKLHETRESHATKLSKLLTKAVRELKMDGASFDIKISKKELGPTGFSKISFEAETNPGEGYYRVKEIASGGELSRILLSLRQVLSSRDSVSIFLFDEIDAGMGGETALHIGKSLAQVAKHSQVIAITHLPQIASYAKKLLEVKKEIKVFEGEERTISRVTEIIGTKLKARVQEMAPISS